jgi:hypothetical protein
VANLQYSFGSTANLVTSISGVCDKLAKVSANRWIVSVSLGGETGTLEYFTGFASLICGLKTGNFPFVSIKVALRGDAERYSNSKGVLFFVNSLGTVHYLWQGVAPKRNVFRGKNFADPTIKKVKKIWLPNLKYQLKNNTHPWPKTSQKDDIQLSHMSFTTSVTWVW